MNDYSFEGKYRWQSSYCSGDDYREPEEVKVENFQIAEQHFIARIKKLLVDRNVLKQELADAIAVSPSSISSYLIGRYHPDLATLLAISNFFEVSTDYLLGKTEYSHINDGNLSPVENEMLGYYRKLSDSRKHEVLGEIRHIYRADKKPDK